MTAPTIREYLKVLGDAAAGADDGDLVARFAATRDQAAFELLVWRHGPLVQRVCRSVLRDHHAAEDAAQATFLVLARKAGALGRGSVVGWLYRVARRVSGRYARQRARHPNGVAGLDHVPAPPDAKDDSAAAVCAEVDRLPEAYRVPILLCFFEGLTHAEAAHRTGWPVGTVAGRLARAKDRLARRLSRRGVGLGAVTLPLAGAGFVGSTARAAVAFASGTPGQISPTVLSLTNGATTTMTTTLLKLSAVAAVVCGVTAGVWGLAPPGGPTGADTPAGAGTPAGPGGGPAPAADPPPAARVSTAPQRAISANNLKQILIAVHSYHDKHKCFPRDITDTGGTPLLSWRVHLLPYMDHAALYNQFKLDEPWDSPANMALLARMPVPLRTPGATDGTRTYYQGFVGPGTVFEPGARLTMVSVTDGLSNTIGVVEAGPPVEWTKPGGIGYDPAKPLPKLVGPFSNAVMVGLLDGTAAAFKPDLPDDVLRRFVERADGLVVDHDAARADVAPVPLAKPPGQNPRAGAAAERLRAEAALAELQAAVQAAAAEKARAAARADELARENRALKDQVAALKKEIEQLKKGEQPVPK